MVTALTKTKRFIRPGITKAYFLPTAADYKALTRTEIDAGTDLSSEIAEVAGWNVTSDQVDAPDWGSRYTKKVPGMISSDDSSITLYASQDGDDVRSLLPRDTTGYVVWMDGGDVGTTGVMDVFPVQVSSVGKLRTTTDPARLEIGFTITDEPDEDQTIPATV